uniref:Uncharacterized protein n=1 Tax=Lepeophtheirus salmonis TaxID=72036 RepID=A0A0K2U7K7_LEPSM
MEIHEVKSEVGTAQYWSANRMFGFFRGRGQIDPDILVADIDDGTCKRRLQNRPLLNSESIKFL